MNEFDANNSGLRLPIPLPSPNPPIPVDLEKSTTKRMAGPPGPPGPPGGWLYEKMSRQQEILFNVMVTFLQIIPQACLTTVFPISRTIATWFTIDNQSILPWLVAAYALAFGAFILIGGRLGDIFGHKNMIVIGFCLMSFWSVTAGLSHYADYKLFFVSRGFQGFSASLLVPNGLALLGRTYPPGSRQKVFSFTLFGFCAPIGAYLGMLFGAVFAQFGTWWWGFYTLAIVTIMCAVLAGMIFISPPSSPQQPKPFFSKLRDMDWFGAILGVGGLICVQVALVSAPAVGWQTQYIYMLLLIGLLLVFFFVITEIRIAARPLIPFNMIKADVGIVMAAVACGWATFGVWTWYLWKWFLGINADTATGAALKALPIVPVALVASVLTAYLMRRIKPSWVLFWALVAFTLGPTCLVLDSTNKYYWGWIFISLLVTPFGMDMSFSAATIIMSNFFPPHMQGVAGSLISTVVNYSISLGLGIAATVEVHTNDSGKDILAGIRGAWYTGVGLGCLGILVCAVLVFRDKFSKSSSPVAGGPPNPPSAKSDTRQPLSKDTKRRSTNFSIAPTVNTDEKPRTTIPIERVKNHQKSRRKNNNSISSMFHDTTTLLSRNESTHNATSHSRSRSNSNGHGHVKSHSRSFSNSRSHPHHSHNRTISKPISISFSHSHSRSPSDPEQHHNLTPVEEITILSPTRHHSVRIAEPHPAYRGRGRLESVDIDGDRAHVPRTVMTYI